MPLSSDLYCPGCLDVFGEPLLLSCSHNVCRDCAVGLVYLDEMRPAGPRGVACPTCRALTTIPCGLESLAVNLALKAAVDDFKRQFTADAKCGRCKVQRAEKECLTCALVLCPACQAETHASPTLRAHHFADLGTMAKQKKNAESMTCKEHGEEKTAFCLTCGCLVCNACGLQGQHKGHNCCSINEAVRQQPPIKNAVGSLQEAATTVKRLDRQLSEAQGSGLTSTAPQQSTCFQYKPALRGDDFKRQRTALSSLRRRIIRGLALSVTAREPADKLVFVTYVNAILEDVAQLQYVTPTPIRLTEKMLLSLPTFTGVLQKILQSEPLELVPANTENMLCGSTRRPGSRDMGKSRV